MFLRIDKFWHRALHRDLVWVRQRVRGVPDWRQVREGDLHWQRGRDCRGVQWADQEIVSWEEDDIARRIWYISFRTGNYGSINGTARLADPGYAEFVVNFDKVPCKYERKINQILSSLWCDSSYDFDPQLPRAWHGLHELLHRIQLQHHPRVLQDRWCYTNYSIIWQRFRHCDDAIIRSALSTNIYWPAH